jgi:aspartyl-tRNA(Asn)/glutamyl-tRNA(Gln) amidotransferase subunit C
MKLAKDEVEHIAALAHLALDDKALVLYQEQLSAILDHAARLQALDTSDISPTATVLPLRTVLRDDVVQAQLFRDQALRNAPKVDADCFDVPPLR